MISRRIFVGGALLASGGLAASSDTGLRAASDSLPPDIDVGKTLNARISDLARRGGGTLHLHSGVYGTRVPIILHGGVEIVGSGATVIRATAPIGSEAAMRSLIETPKGESNCGLVNISLDCADRVSFAAWRAVASTGLRCVGVTAIGWHFGLYFVSSSEASAQDVLIRDTVLRDGGSRQVYPVFLSSTVGGQPFRRLTIEKLKILGSGGAYLPHNAATADQLVLQNVQGFSISDVVIQEGGENGIVIVRGSSNGRLRNITVSGADGHGLQIGGGGVVATIDDPDSLIEGAAVRGSVSGAHAQIEKIKGNRVWLARLTKRQFADGEELWSEGRSFVIREPEFCRNISVTGLRAFGNGRNAANAPGLFADLYISHAEDISVDDVELESPRGGVAMLVNNSRRVPCEVPSRHGIIRAKRTGEVSCAR